MPRGASPKREREYKELVSEFGKEGRYRGREEEVAARIVNKQRREKGETKSQRGRGGSSSRSKSGGGGERRGGGPGGGGRLGRRGRRRCELAQPAGNVSPRRAWRRRRGRTTKFRWRSRRSARQQQ